MLDFRIVILLLITFFVAWLAIIAYRKSRENLAFSLFVFSVGVWSLALALFYRAGSDFGNEFWGRMVYATGSLIAVFFYQFAAIFVFKKINPVWRIIIFALTIFLVYIYIFTPLFVKNVFIEGAVKGYIYGDARAIFDIYFDIYFLAGFLVLLRGLKNETDLSRRAQYFFIIIGTLIGLILASSTNIILPWFGRFEFLWAGPIGVALWASILTYGIVKHSLLDVKIIATEIFVGLMWLVFLVNIFVFASLTELIFNLALFLATLFFGYLLMKSVIKEVTQREELELLTQNLATANERLQELDKLKSEFVSLASHQLRSPLTIIRGYISMLLEGSYGALSQEARKPVEIVMSSAVALIKLINDLLNVSRIESGKIFYDFKPVVFADIVNKVLDAVKENARQKNSSLQFNNFAAQKSVWGDESKLYEVVMNILDNAIKYSSGGQIDVGLKTVKSGEKENILMSCRDNGIGISKEDIPKLFNKFTRSNEAKTAQSSGLGIGLYFAKKVAEDNGGRIWAESPGVGLGSTFFVEFPVYSGK